MEDRTPLESALDLRHPVIRQDILSNRGTLTRKEKEEIFHGNDRLFVHLRIGYRGPS